MRLLPCLLLCLLILAAPASAAPQVTITSGPDALTNKTSADITFTVTEGGTTTCQLDGATPASCTSPVRVSGLGDGAHTFTVRTGDFSAGREWTVDTAPPETTFAKAPPSGTNARSATFVFSSEASARFECASNAAAFTACASPKEVETIHGRNVLGVRAIDVAGNVDPTPASYDWTVDLKGPTDPVFGLTLLGQKIPSAFPTDPVLPVFSPKTAPFAAKPPRVTLSPKVKLSWKTTEAGSSVFLRVERRPEARLIEAKIGCYIGCQAAFLFPVEQPQFSLANNQPSASIDASIAHGRTLCVAAYAADALGNRSTEEPGYSCVARPYALNWKRLTLRKTKRKPDPAAWSGSSVELRVAKQGEPPMRIEANLGTDPKVGYGNEATWVPAVALVGRRCPSCGGARITMKTFKVVPHPEDPEESVVYRPGPVISRTISFSGAANPQAVRMVVLPAGVYATTLSIRAIGGPVTLSGLSLPNVGGRWRVGA